MADVLKFLKLFNLALAQGFRPGDNLQNQLNCWFGIPTNTTDGRNTRDVPFQGLPLTCFDGLQWSGTSTGGWIQYQAGAGGSLVVPGTYFAYRGRDPFEVVAEPAWPASGSCTVRRTDPRLDYLI